MDYAYRILLVVFVMAAITGCYSGLANDESMSAIFRQNSGNALHLETGQGACGVKVQFRSNGDFKVCAVGNDFVKICNKSGTKSTVYPLGAVCIEER